MKYFLKYLEIREEWDVCVCVCVCVCSCVYIVGQSNHMNKEIKNDTFKVNLGLKMEPLVAQKGKEGQDRFL